MQRTHTRREFLTAAAGERAVSGSRRHCSGEIDAEDPRVGGVLADTIGIDIHNHVTPADARPQQGQKSQRSHSPTLTWPTRSNARG